MDRQALSRLRQGTVAAGLVSLSLFSGCAPHCWLNPDNCSTVPKGAIPACPGTYVNAAIDVQRANAAEDDFVIYKNEWCDDCGIKLSPFGQYRLAQIARNLPDVPFPVVIQPCGNPEVDEVRRQFIVECLVAEGLGDAPQRVIVTFPKAEGLYGEEAERIYQDMLNPDQSNALYGSYGRSVYGGSGYLPGTGSRGLGYGGYGTVPGRRGAYRGY